MMNSDEMQSNLASMDDQHGRNQTIHRAEQEHEDRWPQRAIRKCPWKSENIKVTFSHEFADGNDASWCGDCTYDKIPAPMQVLTTLRMDTNKEDNLTSSNSVLDPPFVVCSSSVEVS